MTQDQADYVTDALEMMGIVEPKQIVTEVSGFIPVFEVVLHHYKDYMTALVFGRMWQYCGMSDGVCRASLERIGKDIEVSAVTVMRHAEKLVNDGYLIDTTPDRRNAPHVYMDGRKVEMKSRITAGMTINNATVIKSNTSVINSQLIKQDNTKLNNNDSKPAKDLIDHLLDMANFPGAKAEARRNSILSYLGERLHVNTETKAWREFAKYVDGQQQKGEKIETFIAWLLGQDGFQIQYWPPRRMMELWPQAFVKTNVNSEPKGTGYYG